MWFPYKFEGPARGKEKRKKLNPSVRALKFVDTIKSVSNWVSLVQKRRVLNFPVFEADEILARVLQISVLKTCILVLQIMPFAWCDFSRLNLLNRIYLASEYTVFLIFW